MAEGDTLGTRGEGWDGTCPCMANGNDVEGVKAPKLACDARGERGTSKLEGGEVERVI